MRHRGRTSHLGLLLLASQMFQLGMDNVPPVTLAVLSLNVYFFLFPVAPLMQTCVSVQQSYWYGDWRRLLLSPVHHADDWHLYFNMVSFLWKGMRLEQRLGGAWFSYMLCVFSLLTGCVYLLLEFLLTELTEDHSYSMACAVGFSGVLFALKVVNNYYHPGGMSYIMGIPVSKRYASWVELVLIHVTSPGTSFVGHLAGILVGLLYTSGPLKNIMKTFAALVHPPQPTTYFNSSGTTGFADPPMAPPPEFEFRSSFRDYPSIYSGFLTEEEQLEAAIRNSLSDRGRNFHRLTPPPYGFNVPGPQTAEEVRRRRTRRFDN